MVPAYNAAKTGIDNMRIAYEAGIHEGKKRVRAQVVRAVQDEVNAALNAFVQRTGTQVAVAEPAKRTLRSPRNMNACREAMDAIMRYAPQGREQETNALRVYMREQTGWDQRWNNTFLKALYMFKLAGKLTARRGKYGEIIVTLAEGVYDVPYVSNVRDGKNVVKEDLLTEQEAEALVSPASFSFATAAN